MEDKRLDSLTEFMVEDILEASDKEITIEAMEDFNNALVKDAIKSLKSGNASFGRQLIAWSAVTQATEVIRQMAKALEDIKNCATYAAPPKDFNGVLGYEARVPIEFIDILEKALEAAKPWLEEK